MFLSNALRANAAQIKGIYCIFSAQGRTLKPYVTFRHPLAVTFANKTQRLAKG